jgi:peroxidase
LPHSQLAAEPCRALAKACTLLLGAALLFTPVTGHAGPAFEARSIDGTGNNLDNPTWGSADTPLLRFSTAAYSDGVSAPAGLDRPSPRMVSNALSAMAGPTPEAPLVTNFFWQWGQFLDHDIDLSGAATTVEPMDIDIPAGDPFFDPLSTGETKIGFARSAFAMVGTPAVRQQINQITAFIDASNVYGSDIVRAHALRAPGEKGKLMVGARRLLPSNVFGLDNAPSPSPAFFLAGDVRANEQTGLTVLHTVFVREHNRLARRTRFMRKVYRLLGASPGEDPSGEERYYLARMLVGAELQSITYNEFLPVLLGPDALEPYAGYEPQVNPGIANIFSTAAYRFGHTMVSQTLPRRTRRGREAASGDLPLLDAFFAPHILMERPRLALILRGLAMTAARDVDNYIVDDLRNFLFGAPGQGGFDLAALNIQRGRDHGLPSYNQARIDSGLTPAADFADITSDLDRQTALASVYETVDDVDVWVGGLAEDDRFTSGLIGELFYRIIKDQFERLRDGDRFYYEGRLPPSLVEWVERRTLARILRRNSGAGPELPENVFLLTAP